MTVGRIDWSVIGKAGKKRGGLKSSFTAQVVSTWGRVGKQVVAHLCIVGEVKKWGLIALMVWRVW